MDRPRRKIVIVDYDPSWPATFQQLKKILLSALSGITSTVEHIGSTSIPQLAAKPIIDLNVIIPSMDYLAETVARLELLGYEHEGDLGVINREAFRRQGDDVPRDGSNRYWSNHYLYVCPASSVEHARQILFRDYLIAHPERAAAYAALKLELAAKLVDDIRSYTESKKNFVEETLALAQKAAELSK